MIKICTVYRVSDGRPICELYGREEDETQNAHLWAEEGTARLWSAAYDGGGALIPLGVDGIWIVDGARVSRDQADPDTVAAVLAVEQAEQAYRAALAEALDLAPAPAYAAKATQATFTLLLPLLAKLAAGTALTGDEQSLAASLAARFTGAGSAQSEAEALAEIDARLAQADAAAARMAELEE